MGDGVVMSGRSDDNVAWTQELADKVFDGGEARKFDSDKVRVDLLPVGPLLAVAHVFTLGARKYSDKNYLGLSWRRLLAAALRHVLAWATGDERDEEWGTLTLAHAVCCLLMLMEMQQLGTGTDDRFKEELKSK